METTNDSPRAIPRSMKSFILAHGCPELQELTALRAEGRQDQLLKGSLDRHYAGKQRRADGSTGEDDVYWQPIMSASLSHIDVKTKCIPPDGVFRFLDLGCCPGGFSTYILTKNRQARGVGVSLEVKDGGYGLVIPRPERSRFEMHWGDLTFYDICSPSHLSLSTTTSRLSHTPFVPGNFQLAILDGYHRRLHESESTHRRNIDRLLIAQLIIALESLDVGGTLLVKLSQVESSMTARILYMLDKLSRTLVAFKPFVYATRGMFYAVASGVGLGVEGTKTAIYLAQLKKFWWELTFGGAEGKGRELREDDLDFITDFNTLSGLYLYRLIQLGRGPWRVQAKALRKMFRRIRNGAAQVS